MKGSVSSQYLSATLMAAPLSEGVINVNIIDKLVSVPYVSMTVRLMERFGIKVDHADDWQSFNITGRGSNHERES